MIATTLKGFLWCGHDSKYFIHINSLNSQNNPISFGIIAIIIIITIILLLFMDKDTEALEDN